MLFLFEYRGAKMLISKQFPDTTAAAGTIVSIHVDSDVISFDGRHSLETQVEIKQDEKLHVTIRKLDASINTTSRASNLTNAEIYSLQSSTNPTSSRVSSFNHTDFYSMMMGGSSHNSSFSTSDLKDTTPETCCNYDHSSTERVKSNTQTQIIAQEIDDLHMFVWSSSDSPISNVSSSHDKCGVQVHQNHKINKCISYFN
jgi:predicted DNA binding protein